MSAPTTAASAPETKRSADLPPLFIPLRLTLPADPHEMGEIVERTVTAILQIIAHDRYGGVIDVDSTVEALFAVARRIVRTQGWEFSVGWTREETAEVPDILAKRPPHPKVE